MPTFKRVLLALDLSVIDEQLLQFIAQHAEALGTEKLYLLHIIPDFALPAGAEADFRSKFAPDIPVDEQLKKKIAEQLEARFSVPDSITVEIEVREGKPYEKMLHWLKVKNIDLLVLGKKAISEGSGITAKRVARNASCSVLFVPEYAAGGFQHLVVPNDYSDNSGRAIQAAVQLSRRLGGVPVHSLHIVDLPPEDYYNRTGPGQGYRGLLMESAKSAGREFLKKQKLRDEDIVEAYRENIKGNVPRQILAYAEEHQQSLLIMGAKGHAPFETFLFGSVTEKLAQAVEQQPLLIVR